MGEMMREEVINTLSYLWSSISKYPVKGVLHMVTPGSDARIFYIGEKVTTQISKLSFKCAIKHSLLRQFDVLENFIGAPIVNKKVLEILSRVCPQDFEAFPIVVCNQDKTQEFEDRNYYIINILRVLDHINDDESYVMHHRIEDQEITDIRKLKLHNHCMRTVHLSRDKQFLPLIVVSSMLVSEFRKHKIKGVRFMRPEEVYDRPFPEEYLIGMYPIDAEAAKRYFLGQLNSKEEYAYFKTRVPRIPQELLHQLIDMILSRSDFHREQCEELLRLMDEQ